MTSRVARIIGAGVAAGALALGVAAPAMADDPKNISVTELPKRVVMTAADKIEVRVNAPDGFKCGTEGTVWVAKVPGKQDAVTLSTTSPCSLEGLAVDVTSNNNSPKKNAVVKLIGMNAAGEKSVMTLSVKVTGKTAKPGKADKPGKSQKPEDKPGKGPKS